MYRHLWHTCTSLDHAITRRQNSKMSRRTSSGSEQICSRYHVPRPRITLDPFWEHTMRSPML
ncbi:hypothetical protein BGW80DRAFT_1389076 [Lactifluus volemus]|nr:hypothetical protein BGW80DRAFT_1389076 [Lactifluus volemus]